MIMCFFKYSLFFFLLILLFLFFFFFFFQAEDGIRDLYVTGVQTCALPICGVPAAVPIPAGWKPCRYSAHRSDAPPQAGTSAPPLSGLELSSERSATRAIVVRTRNSSTPGLVSTRCTMPLSTSSESSSVGSSVAWWLPTMSTGRDFDSAPVAISASLRAEWPGGTSERNRA